MQADVFEDLITRVSRLMGACTHIFGDLVEDSWWGCASVTKARILVELTQRSPLTATDLCHALCLDAGYLSRTLGRLEQQGLITRVPARSDGRERLLFLTPAGSQASALLAQRFQEEGAKLCAEISAEDRQQVLNALLMLERALTKKTARTLNT